MIAHGKVDYSLYLDIPSSKALASGTKKEHKPKLLSPDIFRWGRGLPREGGGGQKVRRVPRNQGNQTFWAGYPGIPEAPGKFEKKKFVFNSLVPYSQICVSTIAGQAVFLLLLFLTYLASPFSNISVRATCPRILVYKQGEKAFAAVSEQRHHVAAISEKSFHL